MNNLGGPYFVRNVMQANIYDFKTFKKFKDFKEGQIVAGASDLLQLPEPAQLTAQGADMNMMII